MRWTDVELCDLNQQTIARLDGRKEGATVTLAKNGGRAATVPLALEDPAVKTVMESPLELVLRITASTWSDPLFCGRVVIPDEQRTEGGEAVTLQALDPWAMLERAFIRDVAGTATPQFLQHHQFTGDQSQIMWQLANYNSTGAKRGIRQGTLAGASVSRTLTFPLGSELAASILSVAELTDGPDFELSPVRADDGTLCELNTYYPRQGRELSQVSKFNDGFGFDNVASHGLTPAGDAVRNMWIAMGQGTGTFFGSTTRPAVIARHQGSINLYGVIEEFEERSDTIDPTTLRNWAKAQVAQNAFPVPFFTFLPRAEELDEGPSDGHPPLFGPGLGYYLDDLIAVQVQPPGTSAEAERKTLEGRITDATLTEQGNGGVVVQPTVGAVIDVDDVTSTDYVALTTEQTS